MPSDEKVRRYLKSGMPEVGKRLTVLEEAVRKLFHDHEQLTRMLAGYRSELADWATEVGVIQGEVQASYDTFAARMDRECAMRRAEIDALRAALEILLESAARGDASLLERVSTQLAALRQRTRREPQQSL